MIAARLVHVTGQVQGVGFRPFVHRLASRHHLSGWVRNTSGNVEIEVEGEEPELRLFLEELVIEAPPLARIEHIDVAECPPDGVAAFSILRSLEEEAERQAPTPDAAICPACEAELFDPANRRYHYPFITCTDCGPRYTVIRTMPYDRERTSMGVFEQCARCRTEYHEPGDRRFHSQTNACPICGPRLWFSGPDGTTTRGDLIGRAAGLLQGGGVLALRGLGGFHLAVDATNEAAVRRLRARKHRDAKPFAVMVRTLEEARQLASFDEGEAALLTTMERPVVLVKRRPDARLAPSVAPGLEGIGVMLASTALHHLLLDAVGVPLVMTSGNVTEEPIAIGNAEAVDRLGAVADGFLLHDREILARYDDSVARVVDGTTVFLRRARGYAPAPLSLPVPSPTPLLAVGPHLKNTFTLVDGARAFVSQHIGDLENLETLEHFRAALAEYRRLYRLEPGAIARDLHPDYLSTRVAEEFGLPTGAVQHHHAHVAAVLAEHGEMGPAIGVAFDGTGYGDDGHTWGSEFLLADLVGYRRLGHLRYAPLPGGDLAARSPWRAALGYISRTGHPTAWDSIFDGVNPDELALARKQVALGINAPLASSMGRLFDAAAAIIGSRLVSSYEGQAAMELEALAGARPASEIISSLVDTEDGWAIDPTPLLTTLRWSRERGAPAADLAADFHASIAWMTEQLVRRAADAHSVTTVVLSGGVFQNARLLHSVRHRLVDAGFRVLVPRRLPPNDGAISYGQAAVVAARLAAGVAIDPPRQPTVH
ncbi:MAG: carbamoyltransferase HypF [Gemmatimonadales bacterium]